MDLGLAGRWVLITGASQGIGAATARSFAGEGANLHLTARSEEKLAALRDEPAEAHGVAARIHPLDLDARGAAEQLAREVGDAIVFLASDRSGYTSGAILTIDGGITSRNSIV